MKEPPYRAKLCRAKFSSGDTIRRAQISSLNEKFVTFARQILPDKVPLNAKACDKTSLVQLNIHDNLPQIATGQFNSTLGKSTIFATCFCMPKNEKQPRFNFLLENLILI